jgi:FSR family fosmidomycin resistance protein-like MFS transporter
MTPSLAAAVPVVPWRQDARTIGVVGIVHATSHAFQLLLPPLFPTFIETFGLSYSQLGLLMTVFFVVSAIGQALAGFVVDRVGALPVLKSALGCFALASLVVASAQDYGSLVVASVLLGLGNAPFHPIDFTILNQRVSASRLGHAYSAHGISGNLGWAAAPVFLVGMSALLESWRAAYVGAALWALVMAALVWREHATLTSRPVPKAGQGAAAARTAASEVEAYGVTAEHPLAFLKLPVLWFCFAFFFFATAALAAVQSFTGPALQRMYDLPLAASASVLTGFMLAGAAGMVVGGFLSSRMKRLELTIGVAMSASAVLMLVVASGRLEPAWAMALIVGAGLGSGLAGPSRDMLIRRATPPGATGRVYGTVYSGLDAGLAVAAPIFGWLLDHDMPRAIFIGAALAWLTAMFAATLVGRRLSPLPENR